MKSMKISAVVCGSLVVLALSLPVWSQDTSQSTTTTTQTPSDVPQTTTTEKSKEQNEVQASSQEGDDIEAGNDHNLETGSGDRDSNDNLDHARPVVIPGNRSKCL